MSDNTNNKIEKYAPYAIAGLGAIGLAYIATRPEEINQKMIEE